MSKERTGARIIVGAQYGDEGKGLVSAYLSARDKAALVCRAGVGPNAEHGIFLTEQGPYIKVNQLPLGWMFNSDCQVRIGSGVAVDPDKLFQEMKRYDLWDRVKVDYRCPIITAEHIEAERKSKGMTEIGSTFSGSGYCRADHILRLAKHAQDISELKPFLTDVAVEVNKTATDDAVMVESSQGTYLSLSVSPDYPKTTSDNVTAMAAADDVLLNWRKLKEVIMVVKTMPTREGAGSLGSEELTEQEIVNRGLVELSSIGGVIRRKGVGINWEMLTYAAEINGATQVALTFCEHYDPRVTNIRNVSEITDRIWKLIERVQNETGVPVTLLNTGKPYSSMVDLTGKGVDWEQIEEKLRKYKHLS
jgi:adenylosuccinate synthase